MHSELNLLRSDANDFFLAVRDGDIDGMSFMFRVKAQEWSDLDTDYPKRRITEISFVQEVSGVNYPAYNGTSINARADSSRDSDKRVLEYARASLLSDSEETKKALEVGKAKNENSNEIRRVLRMKDLLKKMLDTRKGKLEKLQERSNASEDVNEVRSIGIEIDQLNEEIRGLEDQIKALDGNPAPQVRQQLNPLASYSLGDVRADELDGVDSIEYRTAFMNFVVKREQIPEDVLTRANASTKTSDVASAVPTILINRIIEKMDNVGMILPLVTHTSYAGGVNIPTSSVKPTATWVAEGATSDRQKKTTGVITFSYHKLRCEISMSMEVGTLALSAFETKFVENVSKAMVKAREDAIINGDGSGKPKGILKETPNEGQALEIAKAGKLE